MKNIVLIAITVVAILGIGGFIFAQNSSEQKEMAEGDSMMEKSNSDTAMMEDKDSMMEKDEAITKDDEMMENGSDDAMMAKGAYIPYSDQAFEDAADTVRVLYFYASWCPTCRPVDQELSQNTDRIPEGVTILRVNYEDPETDASEEALADQYGVTYQHTFVQVDQNGEQITKWNGGGLDEIIQNIQ